MSINGQDTENNTNGVYGKRNTIKKPMNIGRVKFLSLALFMIVTLGIGFLGGWIGSRSQISNNGQGIQKQIISQQGNIIRNISKQVGQSVVSVNDTQSASTAENGLGFGFGGMQPSAQQVAGTGVIITSSG